MSRRSGVLFLVAVALLTLLVVWASGRGSGPAATSVGTTPAGLRGAALLAEHHGNTVASWRRPLTELMDAADAADGPSVLVVTLPLVRRLDADDGAALGEWLAAGHSLVLQTDGQTLHSLQVGDLDTSGLEMSFRQVPERRGTIAERVAPAVWTFTEEGGGAIAVSAPDLVTADHAGDEVVYGNRDVGAVRRRAVGPGVVWLLDGPVLTNRWLARGTGNATLWAAILDGAAGVWFDDYHQGLSAVDLLVRDTPQWPYRLLLAHLALLWMVSVWSVARPYSRVEAGQVIRRSSVARELSDLARIHAHNDHSAGAEASLRAHAGAAVPADAQDLLTLAKRIAAMQDAGRIS